MTCAPHGTRDCAARLISQFTRAPPPALPALARSLAHPHTRIQRCGAAECSRVAQMKKLRDKPQYVGHADCHERSWLRVQINTPLIQAGDEVAGEVLYREDEDRYLHKLKVWLWGGSFRKYGQLENETAVDRWDYHGVEGVSVEHLQLYPPQEDLQGEKVIGMLKAAKRQSLQREPLIVSTSAPLPDTEATAASLVAGVPAAAITAASPRASAPGTSAATSPPVSPGGGHRRQPSTSLAPADASAAPAGHRRQPSLSSSTSADLAGPAPHGHRRQTSIGGTPAAVAGPGHRRQTSIGGTPAAVAGPGHRRQPSADVSFETFTRQWDSPDKAPPRDEDASMAPLHLPSKKTPRWLQLPFRLRVPADAPPTHVCSHGMLSAPKAAVAYMVVVFAEGKQYGGVTVFAPFNVWTPRRSYLPPSFLSHPPPATTAERRHHNDKLSLVASLPKFVFELGETAQLHVIIENNTSSEVKGMKAVLQQLEETRVPSIRNTETRERRSVAEERWKDVVVPAHSKFERDLPLPLPSADLLMPTIATANVSLGYYLDLVVHLGGFFEKDLLASISLALVPPATLHLAPVDPQPVSPRSGPQPPSPRTPSESPRHNPPK